jgi:hypothetical protein
LCNTFLIFLKDKKANPNMMPKTLMTFNGQQKSMGGDKLEGRPKGDQIKHL